MQSLARGAGLFLVLAGCALAQTEERLQFEVASIKPAAPDARGMYIRPGPGGGISVTNMTLKELIIIGWRVQPFQISGGPPWLDSDHYDIVAKPETKPKQGEIGPMIQSLLEDRFQLKLHHDTKELPIYALVVGKSGKLGPGLTESKADGCSTPDPTKPPSPPEPGKPPAKFCGQMMMSTRHLTAVAIPVSNLVPMISRLLGRSVIDKTGLTGKYDIEMDWTPDESLAIQLPSGAGTPPAPGTGPAAPGSPTASESTGPNIFTAFQEQLGLKLDPQKGPVDILVIERAEKPTGN